MWRGLDDKFNYFNDSKALFDNVCFPDQNGFHNLLIQGWECGDAGIPGRAHAQPQVTGHTQSAAQPRLAGTHLHETQLV